MSSIHIGSIVFSGHHQLICSRTNAIHGTTGRRLSSVACSRPIAASPLVSRLLSPHEDRRLPVTRLALTSTTHQGTSWFSTSSCDAPPIEVTVTNTNSSNDSEQDDNEDEDDTPRLSKSSDQITEERILSLQSTLRTHHRHADYTSALSIANELLSISSSHFGTLHPATASAYNNVGLMNKCLGNYEEAKEAYHEALRVYGEVCGKDHSSYAAALSNLGMLERGRAMESEAEDEDEGQVGGESSSEDQGAEAKPRAKMSALERLQLNESAIEYFDEAYRIRLSELGSTHPHTITSRSQLGSAMAASVIAERKGRISGLVETELRKLKEQRNVKDEKEMEGYVPVALARAAAKTANSSQLTKRRWEAAEDHLRGALAMAVDNPRGESVAPLAFVPVGASSGGDSGNEERQGLTLPKKDRSLSKKEQRKASKDLKREKRKANTNALYTGERDSDDTTASSAGGKMAVQGAASKVATLSAATAAQNLAVFLKNYSDWLRLSLLDDSSNDAQAKQRQFIKLNKVTQEARHLYESSLHVRSLILPPHHPEVVATKFSLAELLDTPKVLPSASSGSVESEEGEDSPRANVLREEILNAYNVVEREDEKSASS